MGLDEKDVRLKVTVVEDTRGAKKAAAELAKTAKEADKLDESLKTTAKDAEKFGEATKKTTKDTNAFADSLQDAMRDAKDFDEVLEHLHSERRRIAAEYEATGEKGLLKERARVNRQIGLLQSLKKESKSFGDGFSGILDMGGEGIKPRNAMIAGAVVAVAAAAPMLGAMIGGIISSAVVVGGIGGGIAAASHDSRVQAAAQDFGDTISRSFFSSGAAFVDPVINSLNILEGDFQQLDLGSAFAKAAPSAERLAHGIGQMAINFMPGFNRAMSRSGPIADRLATGLEGTGSALGYFIDVVSEGDDVLLGVETTFALVNGTIRLVGDTIAWLSDKWMDYIQIQAAVSGALEDVPGLIGQEKFAELNDMYEGMINRAHGAGDATAVFGSQTHDAATDAERLARALMVANKEFDDYFNIQMSVDEATLRVKQGYLDLAEAFVENGRHWDNNTEAGIKNRQAILDQVDALNRKRDADIKAAGGTEEGTARANAAYDREIAKVEAMAGAAGATKVVLEDLAGEYTVTFYMNTKVSKPQDWSTLRNAERKSAAAAAPRDSSIGFIPGFASGGTTPAFQPFQVHDGEVMYSDQQHYVATKARVDAMRSAGATSMGGGTSRTILDLRLNGHTLREIEIDHALHRGVSQAAIELAYP